MKVTRLPHDGRMIMGGKGSITPFRLNPDAPSEANPDAPNEAPSAQPPAPMSDMSDPAVIGRIQDKVDADLAKHFGWDKLPNGGPMALSLEEVISRVWQVNPEGALALTPRERRAVELYVSQHYIGPWYLKKILEGGWEHCLRSAWEGPNLYGLA
ncbi:MAG: hypothetical protein V5B36_14020 [Candidatus Accumulibacter sp. UW25]|jgi:hypothetical protein